MLSGLALKTKITLFAIAMFIALSAIARGPGDKTYQKFQLQGIRGIHKC